MCCFYLMVLMHLYVVASIVVIIVCFDAAFGCCPEDAVNFRIPYMRVFLFLIILLLN